MGRVKSIIGILFIVLSVSGLLIWEFKGRDIILMEPVLVAKEDIAEGEKIRPDMFVTVGISGENCIDKVLSPGDVSKLEGKISSQLILKNSQISERYFQEEDFFIDQKESLYVINSDWIAMRSSSLRRGDTVDIFGEDGRGLIGTFQIAFVKDEAEREVYDSGSDNLTMIRSDFLERTDSSAVIDHIEIIATMAQYQQLVSCISGENPTRLLIIQRRERFDT